MASFVPRSVLKSPNSPSRHRSNSWRTVSFAEEKLQKQLEILHDYSISKKTTAYYHSPQKWSPSLHTSESLTSRFKRDYSRRLHASFTTASLATDHGISYEEIICDEIDDILPKTDYTYASSASYSPVHFQENYISPNMSRRRLRSSQPAFLSDDEDEFSTYESDKIIKSDTRFYTQYNQSSAESEHKFSTAESQISEAGLQKMEKLRGQEIMTSTPIISNNQHHISTNDHYYDGILLRSGSHIRGAKKYYSNQKYNRSETADALLSEVAEKPDVVLSSAYISDADVTSQRHNARNIITVTETTTTTTFEPSNKKQKLQKNAALIQDLNERKLRLDESQTEKEWNKQEYKLKHLYGLDSEEEISDVDDVSDAHLSAKDSTYGHHLQRRSSLFSFITTVITVITTITTTLSDKSSSFIKPLTMAASKSVVVSGRWLLYSLGDCAKWLITRSATFLLWDIDVKQKRRRGCCCCFLPLLFLLPLLLLGGYYARNMQHNLGTYMSDTGKLVSSSWSYLWFTSSSNQEVPISKHSSQDSTPVIVTPPTSDQILNTKAACQVDMTQIYQYIQQTVSASAAANKDDRPIGLTKEQVEAIVRGSLTSMISEVTSGLEGTVNSVKSQIHGDIASLQHKIASLESEIKTAIQAHQTLAYNLNQARGSFEGTSAGQKAEWFAASRALEEKLLNLTQEVSNLSSQNAVLTAVMTNCCRNNSAIADIIRAHVISVLSEMGTDEDSQLASLISQINGHYVDKTVLDKRLSAISEEIMNNVKVILADVGEKSSATAEIDTSIFSGINESTVRSIVEEALTYFTADPVGRPDFALESAGGSVVSIRCSETYYKKTALVSVFGIPLWYTSNSPRTVIQPNVHPGECWAFKGQTGYIVFQLSHPIMPTGFTLEHIPRSLAPKGDISSAPKDFTVFGLISESDTQGINLGNYTYMGNGKPIQFFPVQNGHPGIFQLIELRILDNHGNREYTCVYRFQVHVGAPSRTASQPASGTSGLSLFHSTPTADRLLARPRVLPMSGEGAMRDHVGHGI